jgi:hypothetical protein
LLESHWLLGLLILIHWKLLLERQLLNRLLLDWQMLNMLLLDRLLLIRLLMERLLVNRLLLERLLVNGLWLNRMLFANNLGLILRELLRICILLLLRLLKHLLLWRINVVLLSFYWLRNNIMILIHFFFIFEKVERVLTFQKLDKFSFKI